MTAKHLAEQRAQEEKDAAGLLDLAKSYLKDSNVASEEKAIERLRKIVKDYPDTKAAKEAAEMLKKL